MKNRIASLFVLALTIVFASCNTDNNVPINNYANTALYTGVLSELSYDVIANSYESLNINAIALKAAADDFTIGDETKLATLKTTWQATRAAWETSEAVFYGPVDSNGIDGAMDTWPIDVEAMDLLLASGEPITVDTLTTNNEVRGLHLIERLAWGSNGTKTAAEFTAREVEMLQSAATDIQNSTQILFDGWRVDGGNYGANLINAGQSGSIYSSQLEALGAITTGLISLADEVALIKIQGPLIQGSIAEESALSNNSKDDFVNNIKSIQNLYRGDFDGNDGKGMKDIVAPKNETLDTEIETAIDQAIQAIEDIPGTFTDALTNNQAAVENAQAKVAALHSILQNQLLPFISNQ